ncbi:MAG TPA: hypothetical protein V6C58_08440, partial [Allocoleopsis sp.]
NVVLIASQLHSVTQKTKALEKAVKENFGLQLVTDQIIIQDNLKSKLMPSSQPEYTPPPPQTEYIDYPDNTQSEDGLIEIEEPQYNDVIVALEEGKTDSCIIQDVLGYRGRNYQKGKAILSEIKGQLYDE